MWTISWPQCSFCLVGAWKVLCFQNICGSNGTFCARIIQEIRGVVKKTLTNKWAELHYLLDVIRDTIGPNCVGLKHKDIFYITEKFQKYSSFLSVDSNQGLNFKKYNQDFCGHMYKRFRVMYIIHSCTEKNSQANVESLSCKSSQT